jgi:predicted TIM-barrel fold metal-dependent hydrolase
MKAVFLRPNIYNDRSWHDPCYDPLWAACQELNVPIGFHETTGSRMKAAGADRFKNLGIAYIATHSVEPMLACMDVIMGAVMERFPRLRFAFLEGQCGWRPFWLGRMDEHYEWREPYGEMTHLSMPPSEYFRRQGFCAVECDEEFVTHVVDAFGDDNLVTTTDYPHGDSKYPMQWTVSWRCRSATAASRKSSGTTRCASTRCNPIRQRRHCEAPQAPRQSRRDRFALLAMTASFPSESHAHENRVHRRR